MLTLTDDSTSKSVSLNQTVSEPAPLKDDRKKCISGMNKQHLLVHIPES